MGRMWEIREDYKDPREHSGYRYGYRGMSGRKDDSLREAYDCGYEDGYRDAMKESSR